LANRKGAFLAEDGTRDYRHLEAILEAYPSDKILVVDASVDHGSADALVAHERFKRGCVSTVHKQGRLHCCVGFSSGIATIDAARIRTSATHMLEYRRQKLLQEELFASLNCPVFIPQLFTLIGPRTYSKQGAAWAQILRSRVDHATDTVVNEPHSRKAWASEAEVFRRLLRFLITREPSNVTGPLVQGLFTLHEVARGELLPIPPIDYSLGDTAGWLLGDYLPDSAMPPPTDLGDMLLQSLITP
jgi:hypothetical protein